MSPDRQDALGGAEPQATGAQPEVHGAPPGARCPLCDRPITVRSDGRVPPHGHHPGKRSCQAAMTLYTAA